MWCAAPRQKVRGWWLSWHALQARHAQQLPVSQQHPVARTAACLPAVTARLVSPAKSTTLGWAGRLEVKYRGAWVPACASGLNNAAASVICKQVGGIGRVCTWL